MNVYKVADEAGSVACRLIGKHQFEHDLSGEEIMDTLLTKRDDHIMAVCKVCGGHLSVAGMKDVITKMPREERNALWK